MSAEIKRRAEAALGWSMGEADSLSLRSLRDLVRPVSESVAHELDLVIRSDLLARGTPWNTRRRHV